MAWTNITLANKSTVQLYLQQFGYECGPSCVATVMRMIGPRNIDIQQARRTIGDIDPNRPKTFNMDHNWNLDGAYADSLQRALAEYGVRTSYTKRCRLPSQYETFLKSRSTRHPAIIKVEWPNDSTHWVVTVGLNGKRLQKFIEILDPTYGYQRVPLDSFNFRQPPYKIRNDKDKIIVEGVLLKEWSVEV